LRIPQDLSVVAVSIKKKSMHGTPMLTTVDQSIHEMGALATKMLIAILRGEALENLLCKIPTRLVIRESCQAPSSQ